MTGRGFAQLGAVVGAAVLIGCGGAGGTGGGVARPIAEFPSQADLLALGGKPSVKPALPKTAGASDAWNIEMAPVADAAETAWEPSGRWETLFAEVARSAAKKPRLNLAMACLAHELGRFYLQHGATPDQSLRRFLVGGCGNLVPDVFEAHFDLKVPANVKEDEIFTKTGDGLRAALEKNLAQGMDLAGFWFGRRDDKVVAYMVGAREKAQIKPFSLSPNAQGEVVIEGRLHEQAQFMEAYVNYGSAAVAPCQVDLAVPRPQFRFICRPAPGDDTTWVQMLYAPPKRVLSTVFAQALLRRAPDAPPSYVAVRYADPTPVASPEEFTKAIVQHLNRVRKTAGLSLVSLAARESDTAAKLAPHYFSAALEGNPQADLIALGLLAGWEVGGTIRNATLMSEISPTLDAGRWLTSALEMPIGRNTLFSRDIEQVAFGPLLMKEEGVIGAVVTGYRFHHGNNHTEDVKNLLTRVVQSRARMGLPAPLRLGSVAQVMDEELAKVHTDVATPEEALNAVLSRAVDLFSMGMRGFVIEASSLEELEIPEEVLRQPTLHLDIGVTHHKPKGAAWAQYTILVVHAVMPDKT
ncbi:hypothetical protein [Polyangium sp. 6x1]|uniref:hypothetical protein n=1 Tax=Polyangium sp. 6x1 TaxID=3042689 RepID=UPI002482F124|nr:hypothetical protein [Polyangium sp. 6x1]MDI1442540.1 hypothetical protein [Polyangium sp. 6x1]